MNTLIPMLSSYDERLFLALIGRRRRLGGVLMRRVTKLGNWYVIAPLTLALAMGAIPSLETPGRAAAWSLMLSHAVVQLVKRRISRERPSLLPGLSRLVEPEDRFSFPSGHATAGLSVALPLFLALGGAAGGCLLILGASVGVSRCYLGVHYPGDVLAGWALASATVLPVWALTVI